MDKNALKEFITKLPVTPGIHRRREIPVSVVMVLLCEINGEYHFVLQERNANIRQGGEVCFPGGMFDKRTDLSHRETAIRETTEELGLPADKIEIIGRLDTLVAAMGAVIEIFVGVMNADIASLNICRDEVANVFTIPVSYFTVTKPEIHKILVRLFSSETDPETNEKIIYLPVRETGTPGDGISIHGAISKKTFMFTKLRRALSGA